MGLLHAMIADGNEVIASNVLVPELKRPDAAVLPFRNSGSRCFRLYQREHEMRASKNIIAFVYQMYKVLYRIDMKV